MDEACQYLGLENPKTSPGTSGTRNKPRSRPSAESKQKKAVWEIVTPVPEGVKQPDFNHYKHGEPTTVWAYYDIQGRIILYVARYDLPHGKKEYVPFTLRRNTRTGEQKWWKKGPDKPKPLYGLHRVKISLPETVFVIVEGEKAADAGQKITGGGQYCFLSYFGGTGQVGLADFTPLKGRKVSIWPDKDEPGYKAAIKAAALIKEAGGLLQGIVEPPAEWVEKADIADFPNLSESDVFQIIQNRTMPVEEFKELHREKEKEGDKTGADDGLDVEQKAVEELNKTFAVVWVGGKLRIMRIYDDPIKQAKEVAFSSIADFKAYFSNKKVIVSSGKEQSKAVSKANIWLDSTDRREYEGLGFQPPNKAGKTLPDSYYNLWRGFAVKPAPGNCDLYKEHLYNVIANKNDDHFKFLIGWMARCVQDPGGERPGTAIVMLGDEGVGKGTCIYPFQKILGQHFLHLSNQKQLAGNFNGPLKDKLAVFSDEGFWGGATADEGNLKRLITESTLSIEHKNQDAIEVPNFVNLFMATNNDWVVPAGITSRRFFCLDIPDIHRGDTAYFEAIRHEMDNGGVEAFFHFLLQIDYSGINLRKAPKTKALLGQIEQTMQKTPVVFWLYEGLNEGTFFSSERAWPSEEDIETEELKKDYDKLVEYHNLGKWDKFKSKIAFVRKLKNLCPELISIQKYFMGNSIKKRGLTFPSLDTQRKNFEKKLGMKLFADDSGL